MCSLNAKICFVQFSTFSKLNEQIASIAKICYVPFIPKIKIMKKQIASVVGVRSKIMTKTAQG